MPDIHRRPGGPTTADIVRADVAEEIREIADGLDLFERTADIEAAIEDGLAYAQRGPAVSRSHVSDLVSALNMLEGARRGLQHRLRLLAAKLDGTRVL